jgi:hypothetical protein
VPLWRAHSCAPHPDSSGCTANTPGIRGIQPAIAKTSGAPSEPGTYECEMPVSSLITGQRHLLNLGRCLMWGRLATCGRLSIGLPTSMQMPTRPSTGCPGTGPQDAIQMSHTFPSIGNAAELVGQVFNLRPIVNRPGRPRANDAQAG